MCKDYLGTVAFVEDAWFWVSHGPMREYSPHFKNINMPNKKLYFRENTKSSKLKVSCSEANKTHFETNLITLK